MECDSPITVAVYIILLLTKREEKFLLMPAISDTQQTNTVKMATK